MELNNDFRVRVPVDEAWRILTDVERIAPCMPGAQLEEVEGDEYRGVVKVKVGPITAQYKGKATFVELDQDGHRAVLRAEGRDTRGQGNANATITALLEPHDLGTNVRVNTDLAVTGRVAQFGRGVLADVSASLLKQFVSCLETTILAGEGGGATPSEEPPSTPAGPAAPPASTGVTGQPGAGTEPSGRVATAPSPAGESKPSSNGSSGDSAETSGEAPTVRRISGPPAEPVDLLDAAGSSVAKRIVPLLAGLVLLWLIVRRRRRRRGRG